MAQAPGTRLFYAVYRPGETEADEEFPTAAEAMAFMQANGGPVGWKMEPVARQLV